MPAIVSSHAMTMGPAKMMDLASVILDSLAMTVPVISQKPFMIYCKCFTRFPDFANQSFDKCFKKIIKHFQKIIFLVPNSLVKQLLVVEKSCAN